MQQLVNGQRTEVVVMSFHDRILVIVTQLGKIGTLVATFISNFGLVKLAPILL